jgi:membrane protein
VVKTRHLFAKAWSAFLKDKAPRSSAAITFYLILAFSPFLLFMAAASSVLFQSKGIANDLQHQFLETIHHSLGDRQAALIQNLVESANSGKAGYYASVLGLTVSLYGASGLFQQLRDSVNQMWGVEPKPSFKEIFVQRVLAIAMVLVFGLVLTGWVGLDFWLRLVRESLSESTPYSVRQVLSFLFAFAFWTPIYAAIYKWLPQRRIAWRDVWMAAIFTSLSFSITKYLFALYLGYISVNPSYGSAGAIIVTLLWVYYLAQVFFFGVELTRACMETHEASILP